jgi:hypothetical protein
MNEVGLGPKLFRELFRSEATEQRVNAQRISGISGNGLIVF